MKSSESDVVSVARWSVIGTKVYRDDILFAKCANWPNAIAIRDALSCHNDLLEACKVALSMFNDQMFIWGKDDDQKVCHMTRDLARAIAKATPQKEGTK